MPAAPDASAESAADLQARVEAERAGHPFLLFTDERGAQQVFTFRPDAESVSVGRMPSCDVVLGWDDQVSRTHARFERVEGDWDVLDQSRNGTFVNEQRLSGRYRLADGDILRFGTTSAVFRSPPGRVQTAPGATAVGAPSPPPPVPLSSTQRRVLQALCRPYKGRSGFASPATDAQIAEDLFLSIAEVRTHLGVLYAKLDIEQLPDNERRVRLVEVALFGGLISEQDL